MVIFDAHRVAPLFVASPEGTTWSLRPPVAKPRVVAVRHQGPRTRLKRSTRPASRLEKLVAFLSRAAARRHQ